MYCHASIWEFICGKERRRSNDNDECDAIGKQQLAPEPIEMPTPGKKFQRINHNVNTNIFQINSLSVSILFVFVCSPGSLMISVVVITNVRTLARACSTLYTRTHRLLVASNTAAHSHTHDAIERERFAYTIACQVALWLATVVVLLVAFVGYAVINGWINTLHRLNEQNRYFALITFSILASVGSNRAHFHTARLTFDGIACWDCCIRMIIID